MNLKKLITIIAALSLLIGTGDMPIVHAEEAASMEDKISLDNTTQVEEFNNDSSNENNDASESTDTTNEAEDNSEDEPKKEDQSDEDIEEESDEKTYEDTEEESDTEIDNETNDSKDKEDVTFSFLNLTTYQVIGLFDQDGNYYEESTYMGESNVCDKECTTKALLATALEYSNSKNQIEAYLDNHITLPEICPEDYKIVIYLDIDGNITNARAFNS